MREYLVTYRIRRGGKNRTKTVTAYNAATIRKNRTKYIPRARALISIKWVGVAPETKAQLRAHARAVLQLASWDAAAKTIKAQQDQAQQQAHAHMIAAPRAGRQSWY